MVLSKKKHILNDTSVMKCVFLLLYQITNPKILLTQLWQLIIMLVYANDIIAMMSSSAKIDKLHTLYGTSALKILVSSVIS